MNQFYYILAVAGWIWLLVVAVALPVAFAIKQRSAAGAARRGFGVVEAPAEAAPRAPGDNVE